MLLFSGTFSNQDDLFPDSFKGRETGCPDFQSASAALQQSQAMWEQLQRVGLGLDLLVVGADKKIWF